MQRAQAFAARNLQRAARRNFSSGSSDPAVLQAETLQAKDWSLYTVPVVVGLTVFAAWRHASHHDHGHDEDHPLPAYFNYNLKAFPWSNPQCRFFEPECHKKS
mmetsp:Transcript_29234/g.41031  ORF Transcript_29234/g.41031 Transcript_29234/m.41031 type:complete len:103 (-) Transcript_29234:141-449(-)